jgi:hypothetical protein
MPINAASIRKSERAPAKRSNRSADHTWLLTAYSGCQELEAAAGDKLERCRRVRRLFDLERRSCRQAAQSRDASARVAMDARQSVEAGG